MNIKKILFITICVCLFMMIPTSKTVCAKELPNKQQEMADKIAKICIENYEEYGVLPSVCVGQAFIESTLGEHCSSYNLWGIASGKEHYSSLKEGALRYLEVINNGYYKGAPFKKDYHTQIRIILDGGYCCPVGAYYQNIIWSIDTYNFTKYDTKLFKYLKEKKRKEKLRKLRIEENKKRQLEEERLRKEQEAQLQKEQEEQRLLEEKQQQQTTDEMQYIYQNPNIIYCTYYSLGYFNTISRSNPICILNNPVYKEENYYQFPNLENNLNDENNIYINIPCYDKS